MGLPRHKALSDADPPSSPKAAFASLFDKVEQTHAVIPFLIARRVARLRFVTLRRLREKSGICEGSIGKSLPPRRADHARLARRHQAHGSGAADHPSIRHRHTRGLPGTGAAQV